MLPTNSVGAAGGLTGIAYSNAAFVRTAVSRKTHVSAGVFDINLPLTGTPGIECRSGAVAGDHQIVVTFWAPVTIGAVSISSGGIIAGSSVSGGVVIINLTGVANAQTITVTLNNASDGVNTTTLPSR